MSFGEQGFNIIGARIVYANYLITIIDGVKSFIDSQSALKSDKYHAD